MQLKEPPFAPMPFIFFGLGITYEQLIIEASVCLPHAAHASCRAFPYSHQPAGKTTLAIFPESSF
jgi:hypothetical protein